MNKSWDFVICTVPKYQLGTPLQGPAVLKAALKSAGYSCLVMDLNEDLGSRYSTLLKDVSWAELEPVFSEPSEFIKHQEQIMPILEEWVEQILEAKPKVIGLSVFTEVSHLMTVALLRLIRKTSFCGELIIGGSGCEQIAPGLLAEGAIDYYFLGNSEANIVKFAQGERNLPGINSAAAGDGDFSFYRQPDYSDLLMKNYQGTFVTASRGCSRHCTFCEVHHLWGSLQIRPPHETVDEVRCHVAKHEIKRIFFTDSLLNEDLTLYRQLMQGLAEIREEFKWEGFFVIRSPAEMPPEDFDLAKKAQASLIKIGVESGSADVRRHMGKQYCDSDLDYFLEQFQRTGIRVDMLFIVGYPTETEADYMQTLRLLERYQSLAKNGTIANVRIVPLSLQKNTPLWRMKERIGIEGDPNEEWLCGAVDARTRVARYREARSYALQLGYKIRSEQDAERESYFHRNILKK